MACFMIITSFAILAEVTESCQQNQLTQFRQLATLVCIYAFANSFALDYAFTRAFKYAYFI